MKTLISILRIMAGILVGFAGIFALLVSAYQVADMNFRFVNGGPFFFICLLLGIALLWLAWRLVSVICLHASSPQEKEPLEIP